LTHADKVLKEMQNVGPGMYSVQYPDQFGGSEISKARNSGLNNFSTARDTNKVLLNSGSVISASGKHMSRNSFGTSSVRFDI